MATPVIPTLTPDGWDTSPLSQMSKLWEYYQAADYSQSNTFMGRITSLPYTLQIDIEPIALKRNIEKDIIALYGDFFEQVTPLVTAVDNKDGSVSINVNIEAIRDNERYTLSRAIKGKATGIVEFQTKLKDKYEIEEGS